MATIRFSLLLSLVALPALRAQADPAQRRPITVQDLAALREVSDPRISPDGAWVAYTVSVADTARDRNTSDLWMTGWDGRTTLQLTSTPRASESSPRWSPDGRWLAFLSSRDSEDDTDQLWLLDRRGGEAVQVTQVKTGIEDYAWSPDGTRLVLVIEDGDSVEARAVVDGRRGEGEGAAAAGDSAGRKLPKPIVIDRYYFKEDYSGYLGRRRKHLYLFSLADRTLTPLTAGPCDDLTPAWSPDGRSVAFASKRVGADPDRHNNWDLWVVDAAPGAEPRQLTTFPGPDQSPDWESELAWSPDGQRIAYLQGGPDSLIYYAGPRLAVIRADGAGAPTVLTAALDRSIYHPAWSPDGGFLYFMLEDDRAVHLARVPAGGGPVERLLAGRLEVSALAVGPEGRVAALAETPDRPAEVFAVEAGTMRPLSRQNDSLLATLRLVPVEEISATSRDGTRVNGFLVRPLDHTAGTRVPTVLNIHGGPTWQFANRFEFYWQLLAARGYAVVAMNPRGSSGRGEKFALAIWADWGNRDAQDVLAGVDYAVKQGVADPAALGVGGWSYGGILTNYVIARDRRFRAATSGAGISNILAGYGTDQYVREYEAELGTPWKNTTTWLRLSFPFLHADRIRTPTLFLGGEQDFNVPLLNSEQMYQALRSLGVPTRLVIYPGQFHGLDRPSFLRHRLEQYLLWYDEYLRGGAGLSPSGQP